jgi:protocatechuate 3,4-dioxygenase beta subunit
MHDLVRHQSPARRRLTRRAALAWLAAGAAWSSTARAADGATLCIARPEQTEGPFFVDERLERADIRSDPSTGVVSAGTPLTLVLAVGALRASACAPLEGATVDVWQCDAAGRYSDVRDGAASTVGQRFLRGFVRTDARGEARFVTIVPGWYQGRAVHIHFRIATPGANGRRNVFTSQLYFDEAFLDRVHTAGAYATRGGRRLPNASDGLYRHGGRDLLLAPQPVDGGYTARFAVGLTA